jgi:hypothetical protein
MSGRLTATNPQMARIQELIWHIDDNPLDEPARREYEKLIAAHSPNCREVRYLALERELCDARGNRANTERLLDKLAEVRREFTWDDRGWTYTMRRRFDLWLDYNAPELNLAIRSALRVLCNRDNRDAPSVPVVIYQQSSALGLRGLAERVKFFVCRYEHRKYDPPDISDAELTLSIWPSWLKRF